MAGNGCGGGADAGLIRWVRLLRPWRPTKLRLEVEATRSPRRRGRRSWQGTSSSPEDLHSNPASMKIRSIPSALGHGAQAMEPGTARARTPSATLRPFSTLAASRKSSRRPFVHEPMKTVSTFASVTGARAGLERRCRASAASGRSARSTGSAISGGNGRPCRHGHGLCPGIRAPGHMQLEARAVDVNLLVEGRRRGPSAASAGVRRRRPGLRPSERRGRPFRISERSCRAGAIMPTSAHHLRWPCWRASCILHQERLDCLVPANSIAWPVPPAVRDP